MLSILWEIVVPLLVAFVVGWVVMGWLTWRWRRAGVSQARWLRVNDELDRARSRLREAEARVTDLETSVLAARASGSGSNGSGSNGTSTSNGAPTTNGVGSNGAGSEPTGDDPPPVDDVKAIRGVGKKMEAKLDELGITSLRQIAAFTDEDIERVSAAIGSFPGRIERDRWVPQAKELVARLDEGSSEAAVPPASG